MGASAGGVSAAACFCRICKDPESRRPLTAAGASCASVPPREYGSEKNGRCSHCGGDVTNGRAARTWGVSDG